MSKNILILGNGGHARSVLDTVFATNSYDKVGIVVDEMSNGDELIVGIDEDLPNLFKSGWNMAFVAVGSVGDVSTRQKLYKTIKDIGFAVPSIVDPSAIVSEKSVLKDGIFVGKGAIINSNVFLDECAIINSGAIIEHDCKIGKFVHVSTGAVLCGGVVIDECSHVGAGSVIREYIEIGKYSLCGAGSVVVSNIPDYSKGFGNPFRVLKL